MSLAHHELESVNIIIIEQQMSCTLYATTFSPVWVWHAPDEHVQNCGVGHVLGIQSSFVSLHNYMEINCMVCFWVNLVDYCTSHLLQNDL